MERVGGKERKYQVDGRSFCSTIVEFCVFVCGSRLSVGRCSWGHCAPPATIPSRRRLRVLFQEEISLGRSLLCS